MSKELVIAANRHEIKVGILEDDQLVEVFFQRANEYSLAGSIHKGRVTRVLPGMQSAFVDLGLERDTFLYVSDFSDETEEDFDRVSVNREPRDGDRVSRAPVERPPAPGIGARGCRSHRNGAARQSRSGRSRGCSAGATERTDRGERPDRWRSRRTGWRSWPAFPPPPWPRPGIPGFQVRLSERRVRRASVKQRPRPPAAEPSAFLRRSSSGRGSARQFAERRRQPTSPFSPASLSPNTRAPTSSRWRKPKKMRFAICRRPRVSDLQSETLAEIAEEAIEEPDDAPVRRRE